MAFRLPRLPMAAIVDPKTGHPSQAFTVYWQRVIEGLEEQERRQDEIIARLNETINRIRRLLSHTEPTTILQAADDGATCTVTLLPHTRVYADGTTQAVAGDSESGIASNVWVAVYYDDVTMAEAAPAIVFTTDLEEAQAAKADGRHFCGQILTPEAGSGDTIESGGSYPGGSGSVGGEVEGTGGIDP